MSQFPYPYGFGQNYGQHPPHPYAYQNVGGFPAFPPNVPYSPSATQINRDASQAAYQSNAIHIPGLGAGGAAPPATQHNIAPGVAAWNNQAPSIPTFAPGFSSPQAHGRGSSGSQQAQASHKSGPKNAPQLPNKPTPAATVPADDIEMEEGELSEGQFEDLYEPREYTADASAQMPSKPVPLPAADPSQPPSAADTPDGGFYGTDEDDGGKGAKGKEGTDFEVVSLRRWIA